MIFNLISTDEFIISNWPLNYWIRNLSAKTCPLQEAKKMKTQVYNLKKLTVLNFLKIE